MTDARSSGGNGVPIARSIDAAEQSTITNREWPFPEFPQPGRTVGREKDELCPADQILRRDITDRRQHAAVLRIVAIVAHHEVVTGGNGVDLRVVERAVVAHLDDQMFPPIR